MESTRLRIDFDSLIHAQRELATSDRPYVADNIGDRRATPILETRAWAEYIRQTRLLGYTVEYGKNTSFRKDDFRTLPPKDLQ